ncbi:hypothetical protein [Bacillus oleivorans]|uniref:hypothetical protein n=1 Tax=Bacillus oleivorans TaxID=1448271 RepID=UPI00339133E1
MVKDEQDTPIPREILKEKIKEVDGLLCLLTEEIDSSLINFSNNLKAISNMAVG